MGYVWVIVLYNALGPAIGLFSTPNGTPITFANRALCENARAAAHLSDINLMGQHGKCSLRQTLGHKLLRSKG